MAASLVVILCAVAWPAGAQPASSLPELTDPVNDFAHVIDSESAAEMDRIIRALQATTGDVIAVVTVPTIEPAGDIRAYAENLFENHGRGIGEKGKDNGLLILLALKERRVWIEVGYGLEPFITDGFSGETSREVMAPEFKDGRYGAGLLAGTRRIAGRIAQGRNVTLDGVPAPSAVSEPAATPIPLWVIVVAFIIIMMISRGGGGPRRRNRYWGGSTWSGWSSGVGPFGGGWGGGFGGGGGGGGFGGGFGGFGGGRSGGGGGGASW